MNSLEFIKMHVDEWPSTHRHQLTDCMLLSDGILAYGAPMGVGRINPYEHIDLSEHFAPDYYDGKLWTREDFESFGDGDDSSIEWEDTSVCYADGRQWNFDTDLLTDCSGNLMNIEGALQYKDFQLNEIQQGDCIAVDEIDDEDDYNNVVDVFMLFVFPRWEDAGFEDTLKSKWLVVDKVGDLIGVDYLTSGCKRMVTYKQLMAIGKLKKMLNDKLLVSAVDIMGRVLNSLDTWSPTINSIVHVGDCEGVVKAIDGEHYWVLKDTGMYDTYHKGSLKKPLTEEEKLHKDNIMGAAFVRSSVAEQLIQDLDKRGYKIVRKED